MPSICEFCKKTRRDGLKLFSFPAKKADLCKKWIEKSGKINLFDLNEKQIRNRFVCEKHFKPTDFMDTQCRYRLKSLAVPSVNCGDTLSPPQRIPVEEDLEVWSPKRTNDRLRGHEVPYFPTFHTNFECCVPECGDSLKPLCRLPTSKVQQRKWLRVICNPILETKSVGNVNENYRICRKHFTDEAFRKWRTFKKICYPFLMNIMPTLHLPVIKEDSLMHTDSESNDPTSSVQSEPSACYDLVTNESLQSSPTEFIETFDSRDAKKHQNLCCVPGCGDLMKPLIRLPRLEILQQDWLRVIGNPILALKSSKYNYDHFKVCRKHFTDEEFYKVKHRNQLSKHLAEMDGIPTLHMPVLERDPPSNVTDNKSISLISTQPSVRNEPMTRENIQNDKSINIGPAIVCSEPSEAAADTSAYHIKVKIEPSGKEQVRTKTIKLKEIQIHLKKEPLDSYMEVDTNGLNETKIFASSSNMEECVEFSAEDKKLFKIEGERVRPDVFGEHVTTKLESYNQNTQTVVQNLIAEILLNADKGLYETALTPTI